MPIRNISMIFSHVQLVYYSKLPHLWTIYRVCVRVCVHMFVCPSEQRHVGVYTETCQLVQIKLNSAHLPFTCIYMYTYMFYTSLAL